MMKRLGFLTVVLMAGVASCSKDPATEKATNQGATAAVVVQGSGSAATASSASGSDAVHAVVPGGQIQIVGQLAIEASIDESVADRRVDLQDSRGNVVASAYSDAKGRYAMQTGQLAIEGTGLIDEGYAIASLIDSDKTGKVFGIRQAVSLTGTRDTAGRIDAGVAPFAEVAAIKGAVRFVDGTGVEDLKIARAGTDAYIPGLSFFAKTDAAGRFLLLYVPAGAYTLRVEKTGFSREQAVTVEDGKTANVGVVDVVADTRPPVTSASKDSTDFRKPFCVTLTADEDAKVFFTADGSTPVQNDTFLYAAPVCVQDHSTTLKYFAVDAAGNIENQQSKFYFFNEKWADPDDHVAPVTTLRIGGAEPADGAAYGGSVMVALTVGEGASTFYSLDPAATLDAFLPYSQPIKLSKTSTMRYYAVDYARNVEAVKSKTLNLYSWKRLRAAGGAEPLVTGAAGYDERHAALSYDAARKSVVMVTASDGGGTLLATYEWSGTAWTPKGGTFNTSTPAFAGKQYLSLSMFYDAGLDQTFMVLPTYSGGGPFYLDVYKYDPANLPHWNSTAQTGAAMSWDSAGGAGWNGFTAAYDPLDASLLIGAGTSQIVRSIGFTAGGAAWRFGAASAGVYAGVQRFVFGSTAFVSKAGASKFVFYGAGSDAFGMTLELPRAEFQKIPPNGIPVWTEVSTAASPPPFCPETIYVPPLDRVLLFGGADTTVQANKSAAVDPLAARDETWAYDGQSWELQEQATKPGARYCAAMVYDSDRKAVLLFGGTDRFGRILNDTWELSLAP